MAANPNTAVERTKAPTAPEAAPRKTYKGASAQEMSARQRDISVAEFFQKNRHLLGFDNPRKALLTTIKEAVDNSLDACEEAGILPDITVRIEVAPGVDGKLPETPAQADRFIVTVEDNGPGIVRKNVGKVFAKLLYGSKFHRLRMSRGQQGIGISAAGMYGQLTTGKPTKVKSKISSDPKAHCFEISIDTKRNEPVEHETKQIEWDREHGTSVSIELSGKYQRGKGSVDEYLELTSIANPHVKLTYIPPDGDRREFKRGVEELPHPPREIKPHPYGIELGMLLKMLQDTQSHWLSGFLASDFSRVSTKAAEEICKAAKLSPRARPRDIIGKDAEALYRALQAAKLMAPPTDCISPIGEKAILAGLYKEIKGDFYTAVTRPPAVYRGNPFVIEAGLAFGNQGFLTPDGVESGDAELPLEAPEKELEPANEGTAKKKMSLAELRKAAKIKERQAKAEERGPDIARLIRFANRVPLLYQQTACSTFKAAVDTTWKKYGLNQSRGSLPQGSMAIFVHVASVWVPFTSESKEAVADYDEINKEIRLALQECGRRLKIFLNRRDRAKYELDRRSKFALYIHEVAESCGRLKLKFGKVDVEELKKQLQEVAEKVTGGDETESILSRKENAPEELPNTIIVNLEAAAPEEPLALAPSAIESAPISKSKAAQAGNPGLKTQKSSKRTKGKKSDGTLFETEN